MPLALPQAPEQTEVMREKPGQESATLIRATLQPDGAHSSELLSAQVHRGLALRIRRGIYVDASAWICAPPWQRHRMAVAATAMRTPSTVVCRESALALHGLPLTTSPGRVTVRTAAPGWAGTRKPPTLTGQLSASAFRSRYLARNPGSEDFALTVLNNLPERNLEPAIPGDTSRIGLRAALKNGTYRIPQVTLDPAAVPGISGPETAYRVEPLGLALVDTVSRMDFPDAVVVLDAVKAGPAVDLEPWLHYMPSERKRRQWEHSWDFADARAESPGESLSRAHIHQLGFAAPDLQRSIRTEAGEFRLDFCWPDDGVIGEFDGKVKYFDQSMLSGRDPREVLYLEKQREDALRRAGWIVVRWGWDELRHPQRLAQRLRTVGVSRRLG